MLHSIDIKRLYNYGGVDDYIIYDEYCPGFVETYVEEIESDDDLVVSYVTNYTPEVSQVLEFNKYLVLPKISIII